MGRCYPHLSLEERRKIDTWREARMSISEIADRLGRARSTIYRELKRNHFDDKDLPKLNPDFKERARELQRQLDGGNVLQDHQVGAGLASRMAIPS